MKKTILYIQAEEYFIWLARQERSETTRNQYRRDIFAFLTFLGEDELKKDMVLKYKQKLEQEYKTSSVNAKLVALNGFFSFMERNDLRLKLLKIQRRVFCSSDRELTKNEYLRLIRTAEKKGDKKLSLLLQTICGTGIRVSELQYITAEAVRAGEAVIRLKGKIRSILIPGKLQKLLKNYICREGIITGSVFVTKNKRPLDRSNIWRMMKILCRDAGVENQKVFPHNLRHLFARVFYAADKDLAKLADILGHSNINTTRIYIMDSGQEHRRRMDSLGLVFP